MNWRVFFFFGKSEIHIYLKRKEIPHQKCVQVQVHITTKHKINLVQELPNVKAVPNHKFPNGYGNVNRNN